MISMNLRSLRKANGMTQEQLAEKMNVSRQAVTKWENGEAEPDIKTCSKLARLFGVTLDNLVNFNQQDAGVMLPPKGKHFFGAVTVNDRGQIVIPVKAREVFDIRSGDTLLVVGDEDRGLAIVPRRFMEDFFGMIATGV